MFMVEQVCCLSRLAAAWPFRVDVDSLAIDEARDVDLSVCISLRLVSVNVGVS